MARVAAILKALVKAMRRDEPLASAVGNNFFLVTALLLQKAGAFLYLVMGLVLLFPMSSDPLRKIPPSRLALWPLDRHERWALRVASPWVNPITWLLAALALWAVRGHVSPGLWAAIAAVCAAGFALPSLQGSRHFGLWRRVPQFPGPLNQLIRKNLREIFSTLDFYCALLLSVAALVYRLSGREFPEEARLGMTLLILLALSSYAQCLFGLDGRGGISRYGLLPLAGWQLLAAKDAAYLVVATVLTLPLAPLAGLGAAMVALTFGRGPSIYLHRAQTRWRFSSGAPLMSGLGQAIAMGAAGSGIFLTSVWILTICAALWAGSLWWYGRQMQVESFLPVQE